MPTNQDEADKPERSRQTRTMPTNQNEAVLPELGPTQAQIIFTTIYIPTSRLFDMDQTSSLMFGMLFGAIGTGFIVYGRKQRQGIALLCGIVLVVFPYFVDSLLLLFVIGAVLMAVPFLIRS